MSTTRQMQLYAKYNPTTGLENGFDSKKMAAHCNFEHGPNVIPELDDFDTDIVINKCKEGELSESQRDNYLQSVFNFKLKKLRESLHSNEINIAHFLNAENLFQRYCDLAYVNTKIVQLRKIIINLPSQKLQEYKNDRSDNPKFRIMNRADLLWYDKVSDSFTKKLF
jgi:hypothetical protein